jgi:hypothetical protein
LTITAAAVLVIIVVTSHDGMDPLGRPVGTDFASFWTASTMALHGGGAAPYDASAHQAAQAAAFPGIVEYFAFFYPPTFLLLCLWLGALPYLAALGVWLVLGFGLLFGCVRRLLPAAWPARWAFVALAGFPGVLQNALHGQNGTLSAACFGWAAVSARDRRPGRQFAAGAALGLLVFKPHLLIAAPVVLLAGRRWSMIAGGLCSGLGLCLISWALLGSGAWTGFAAGATLARQTLENGLVGPEKMQSAFAAIRLLGGSVPAAYATQAVTTAAVLAALAITAWRRPGAAVEVVLLGIGAMLCSPFLLDYDLVCLAIPLAWLLADAQTNGFRRWDQPVMLAAYALPLLSRQFATYLHAPIAPAVIVALLWLVGRRAWVRSAVVT